MIQALADLHFLRPQWLWALLALPLLALWGWRRRRRDDTWRRRVDAHLLPHLLVPGSGRRGAAGVVLALAGAALAILAMAGPGWRDRPQPLWTEAAPLVVALDLSSATTADDLQPSRLLQARATIDRLLAVRKGGQVALVVFAGEAHVVAPLTSDAGNVRVFLDALAPDIMPTDGSQPERAIALAADLLRRAGFARGDILLLTHTAGPAAQREAAAAARAGYAVSVMGLGTGEGAVYRDSRGRLRRTRMDADALGAVAAAGAGRYAALDQEGADALAGNGASVEGAVAVPSAATRRAAIRVDQGYWLLLPLLLLAALAFRRGGVLGLLALGLCLPLLSAPAQARAGSLWQRPDQAAHQRALDAVVAYRAGDYDTAARIWNSLPGPDAAYNRGNALARAGRLQDALDAYDAALAQAPGMEDALANRAAVENAMQRPPPDGGGAPERGEPQPESAQGEDGAGADGGGQAPPSGSQDKDGTGAKDGKRDAAGRTVDSGEPDPGQPDPPPEAADAGNQREADDALREQVQQALARAQDGEGAQAETQTPADVGEREQREAAEAWLRRIPDDPGGLLRARFRLEHERRRRERAD